MEKEYIKFRLILTLHVLIVMVVSEMEGVFFAVKKVLLLKIFLRICR